MCEGLREEPFVVRGYTRPRCAGVERGKRWTSTTPVADVRRDPTRPLWSLTRPAASAGATRRRSAPRRRDRRLAWGRGCAAHRVDVFEARARRRGPGGEQRRQPVDAAGHSPAWTLHGTPLAHVERAEFGQPDPADHPRVFIGAERISGPILTFSGGDDLLWPSSSNMTVLEQRLEERHFARPTATSTTARPDTSWARRPVPARCQRVRLRRLAGRRRGGPGSAVAPHAGVHARPARRLSRVGARRRRPKPGPIR